MSVSLRINPVWQSQCFFPWCLTHTIVHRLTIQVNSGKLKCKAQQLNIMQNKQYIQLRYLKVDLKQPVQTLFLLTTQHSRISLFSNNQDDTSQNMTGSCSNYSTQLRSDKKHDQIFNKLEIYNFRKLQFKRISIGVTIDISVCSHVIWSRKEKIPVQMFDKIKPICSGKWLFTFQGKVSICCFLHKTIATTFCLGL